MPSDECRARDRGQIRDAPLPMWGSKPVGDIHRMLQGCSVSILEERPHAGCGGAEGTPPGLQREQPLNGDPKDKQVLVRGQTRAGCQRDLPSAGWLGQKMGMGLGNRR